MLFLIFLPISYASETLNCFYDTQVSTPIENVLFYAHSDLSSNVAIDNSVLSLLDPYQYVLRCDSDFGSVSFYDTLIAGSSNPCGTDKEVLFLESTINSRVSNSSDDPNYNRILCASIPPQFATLDVLWYDENNPESLNPSLLGYTCMFKTNDIVNGHVSACNATFNVGETYSYSVWARLFESFDSLDCSSDCTSNLDGRVYVACNQKISSCNVPVVCNGALFNSFVTYSSSKEVQCSSPWNKFRSKVFTNDAVKIESESDECEDIIKKSYVTFLNNEQVVMNIYICQDSKNN